MTGVPMMWLRSARSSVYFDFFGLQSNFHSSFDLPAFAARIEAVEPAVAAAEDHLRLAAEHRVRGRRPLAVQHIRPGELSVHSTLPVFLSTAMKRRGIGGRQVDVGIVDAVGGVHEQHVAGGGDRATAHVVLLDAQLLHHVEHPDHVGFFVFLPVGLGILFERRFFFIRDGSVIFAAAKSFGVRHLTSPRLVTYHSRLPSTNGAQQSPSSGQSFTRPVGSFSLLSCQRNLPVFSSKQSSTPKIDVGRVALQIAGAVIGADVDLAVGNDGIAVAFETQLRSPLDVLRPLVQPSAGVGIELAQVPFARNVFGLGRVVANGRAAPLAPIVRAHAGHFCRVLRVAFDAGQFTRGFGGLLAEIDGRAELELVVVEVFAVAAEPLSAALSIARSAKNETRAANDSAVIIVGSFTNGTPVVVAWPPDRRGRAMFKMDSATSELFFGGRGRRLFGVTLTLSM